MSYSNIMLKGKIGFNSVGWPIIVMERAKSDKPKTPVLCEVWGYEHECGSIYYDEIQLTDNYDMWVNIIKIAGGAINNRYFKGELLFTGQK